MSKIVTLIQDEQTGEVILPLPEELLDELDWVEGDLLNLQVNEDGALTLTRSDEVATELVLIETISTFHHKYVVRAPVGHWKAADLAKQLNLIDNANELSQNHVAEVVLSQRTISKQEFLDMANEQYPSWSEDQQLRVLTTPLTCK